MFDVKTIMQKGAREALESAIEFRVAAGNTTEETPWPNNPEGFLKWAKEASAEISRTAKELAQLVEALEIMHKGGQP